MDYQIISTSGLTTTLMGSRLKTQSVVVSAPAKNLDLHSRKVVLKWRCESHIVDEVLGKVLAILE